MLRVGIVINELAFGGAETIVQRLAIGARAHGIDVEIAAVRGTGMIGDQLRRAGIAVLDLGVPGGLRRRPRSAIGAALRLGARWRSRRVRVVQGLLFEGNLVGRVAARRAGAHMIASFRSNLFRLPFERWVESSTRGWITRYTAVSEAVAEQAAHTLTIPRHRIVTIPNGIAVDDVARPPAQIRTLGYLGRLHREKGVDLLLRALAGLASPVRLQIAGEGPERSALQTLVINLGLGDQVQFTGLQNNPGAFLATIDALIVPARVEGLSNAALEAMAAARPVIVTDVGGNRDLIANGGGWLVPPEDPEALTGALLELLVHPDPAQLGRDARHQIATRFGLDRMLTTTFTLWRAASGETLPYVHFD